MIHCGTSNINENFFSRCAQLKRGKSINVTQAGMFMYTHAGFVPVMVNTPTGQSWEINSYKDSLNLEPGPVLQTVFEKRATKAGKKQKYRD